MPRPSYIHIWHWFTNAGSQVILRSFVLALLVVPSGLVEAATPLSEICASADITVKLSGTDLKDHQIGSDDLAGTVSSVLLFAFDEEVDLDGYHLLENGDQLFSIATAASLNGLIVGPADVVRLSGATLSLEFDGSPAGAALPHGARIDALTRIDTDLLMSFDVTVDLGSGLRPDDEDLVRWNGSTFAAFFDGSAAGIDPSLDLDAADYLTSDKLLLSFDSSGTVGVATFSDEDVLEYTVSTGTWEVAYDGSAEHAGWHAADLDALDAKIDPSAIFSDGFEIGSTDNWSIAVGFP